MITLQSDSHTKARYKDDTLTIEREGERLTISRHNAPAMLSRLKPQVAAEIAELIPSMRIKNCPICCNVFFTIYPQRKTCDNPDCHQQYKAKQRKEYKQKKMSRRKANLDKDTKEARKLGMSYGKYKAMLYLKEAPSVLDSK